MRILLLLFAAFLFSGCATYGPSAEQITAMKGTSSSLCFNAGPGLYTPAVSVHYSSFGGQAVGTGGGSGDATCKDSVFHLNNEGRAQPGPVIARPIPSIPGPLPAPKVTP